MDPELQSIIEALKLESCYDFEELFGKYNLMQQAFCFGRLMPTGRGDGGCIEVLFLQAACGRICGWFEAASELSFL